MNPCSLQSKFPFYHCLELSCLATTKGQVFTFHLLRHQDDHGSGPWRTGQLLPPQACHQASGCADRSRWSAQPSKPEIASRRAGKARPGCTGRPRLACTRAWGRSRNLRCRKIERGWWSSPCPRSGSLEPLWNWISFGQITEATGAQSTKRYLPKEHKDNPNKWSFIRVNYIVLLNMWRAIMAFPTFISCSPRFKSQEHHLCFFVNLRYYLRYPEILFNIGQSRLLFVYFRTFHITIKIWIENSKAYIMYLAVAELLP